MTEGWHGDDYLILFGDEAPKFEKAYALSDLLPAYRLLGLKAWDDFIVEDRDGARFTVPTVPVLSRHLSPFDLGSGEEDLTPDNRFRGKIKWYITPVAFGGDPSQGDNVTWVTLGQHAQLVRFWNQKYRALARDA
jgi:hypothetical protein